MAINTIKYTSANVDGKFFDELAVVSKMLHMHEDDIFKDLIALTKQHIQMKNLKGLLTEYQNHDSERWEMLHYSLDEKEIEIYGKMRQKYKMSISKIAFVGFILFWELLLYIYKERLKKSFSKNIFCSYRKIREKFENLAPIFIKRLNIQQKE